MILAGVIGPPQAVDLLTPSVQEALSPRLEGRAKDLKTGSLFMRAGQTDSSQKEAVYTTEKSLLMGRVFDKNPSNPHPLQTPLPFQEMLQSYWGSYLCCHARGNTLSVLRDPIGQRPFFYKKSPLGGWLFSSELSVLCDLLGQRPAFNWDYLKAYLLHGFITSSETIFEGIFELPHGCSLTLSTDSETAHPEVAWNPYAFCGQGAFKEREFEEELLATLKGILSQWIGSDESCLVDFSGGLDSSALLILLAQQAKDPKALTALNMFHPLVQSSDERSYARRLSDALGTRFQEFDHTAHLPGSVCPVPSVLQKPNWPTSSLFHLKIEQDIGKILPHKGHFVSGHGGDHCFLCPPPLNALSDFILQKSVSGVQNKMYQLSSLGRIPFFALMNRTLGGILAYTLRRPYKRESVATDLAPWLSPEVLKSLSPRHALPDHPLFEKKNPPVLPGKFTHLETIMTGLSTLKGSLRDPSNPIFYPLFSQPIIELCLKMPTYASFEGGYNRVPFRKALSRVTPPDQQTNLWRQDKGETTGLMQRGLHDNKDFILDLCLKGTLVKKGLVDSDLLLKGLMDMIQGKPDDLWPLNNLISLELFFRLWE